MVSVIEFCCSNYDQFDENLLMWWKFVSVMKIPHCDENSLMWWKIVSVIKIDYDNENLKQW